MLNCVSCYGSEHKDQILCVVALFNDMQVCEKSCGYMLNRCIYMGCIMNAICMMYQLIINVACNSHHACNMKEHAMTFCIAYAREHRVK